jgi:hypothetical protein
MVDSSGIQRGETINEETVVKTDSIYDESDSELEDLNVGISRN